MMYFRDVAQFSAFLALIPTAAAEAQKKALGEVGAIIETEAKAEIGTYQGEIGEIPEWAPLAHVTLYGAKDWSFNGKIPLGYATAENHNPLLRTGGLRDSISHEVEGNRVVVGSRSEVALDQEMGTPSIPARSFLGGALFRKAPEAAKLIGLRVSNAIGGKA